MEWVPTPRVDVVNCALLLELIVPVPSVALPFLNVTVPVAAPPKAGVIVAVNVTEVPWVEGFFEDTSPTFVVALWTAWPRFGDVLVTKFPLPL